MAASRHTGGIVIMVVLTVASAAMFLMPRLTRPDAATPSPSPTASASVEQVIEFYRQVVEANPQDMKAQLILANASFDHKDYAGAIKAYQAVLTMDPTNVNARVDMATAYYYEKVYAVALVQLKKAQAQEPNNVHALYNLGVVHHSMGQFEEARTHWQRASQLATDPAVKAQIDERLQRASKNPFK